MAALPPIHRWDTIAQPRALVHVVHGMSEHGMRYGRFAEALNRAGFNVWAHDHRGHGINPTTGQLGHFGDAGGWRALVDDAWAVSEAMQRQSPGLPLFLFTHSMGSFAGQMLMAEHGTAYRGVVLCGTNGPPTGMEAAARAIARVQRLIAGARGTGMVLSAIVFGDYNRRFAPTRTRFDWLSRDPAEVDKYIADPLCGFSLSAQSWLEFLESKPALGTDAYLQRIPKALPILVIAGTRDPVGDQIKGVTRLLEIYANAGLTDVSHRFYSDARHELVNETNHEEITRDVIAWIERCLERASARSGVAVERLSGGDEQLVRGERLTEEEAG